MGHGRRKKIDGQQYSVALTVSGEEFQGVLDLIAKRFRETGIEYTKQDLVREAVRMLLIREGLLPTAARRQRSPSILALPSERKN